MFGPVDGRKQPTWMTSLTGEMMRKLERTPL
jgi:hypothetical protein